MSELENKLGGGKKKEIRGKGGWGRVRAGKMKEGRRKNEGGIKREKNLCI